MADRFDEATAQSQVRRFCCNDDDDGGVGDDNDDDTPGADYPKSRMFLSADEKSVGACSEMTILRDRLHLQYFFLCVFMRKIIPITWLLAHRSTRPRKNCF